MKILSVGETVVNEMGVGKMGVGETGTKRRNYKNKWILGCSHVDNFKFTKDMCGKCL